MKRTCIFFWRHPIALCNVAMSDSTLKKRSMIIACHLERKGVAKHEWRVSCTRVNESEVGLLEKTISREKRKGFYKKKYIASTGLRRDTSVLLFVFVMFYF